MTRVVVCLLLLANALRASSFDDVAARAAAARESNEIPQAIELYKQALELNPKWEEGWWYAGSLLYDADRYAEAREALEHVIELDPKAGTAWGLLGLCKSETGDHAGGLKDISHSLEIDSNTQPQMEGVLRYNQATLMTRTGAFDQAITEYGWFVRKGVQNPSLIAGIGLAALRSPLLPREIPTDQQDLYTRAGQAGYLTLAGDYLHAEQTLKDLLERYPRAHYVHYMQGCFLMTISPELAIVELRRELDVNPTSAAANGMLAWELLEVDDPAEALPYARAAAQDDPGSEIAQYVLGRSLVEQGQVKPGLEHLQAAEKINPVNIQAHISLATAYSKAGRPEEARRERRISIEMAQAKGPVAQR